MKVLRTFPVPGEGGWDYLTVDAESNRLFVSHGMHVAVIDIKTGQSVGEIADTPGVHGIAIANKLGKGFISAGRANTVIVFDLKDLSVKSKIPTGKNPDFILSMNPRAALLPSTAGPLTLPSSMPSRARSRRL